MAMPPDFNSSDISADEVEEAQFTRLGRRTIGQMLDHAFEDRRNSKVAVKTLRLNAGTPSVQYGLDRWRVIFYAFYEVSLQKLRSQCPTAQDIERFITVLPLRCQSPRESGVVGYGYLLHALQCVINILIFDHKEFDINKHDRRRLKSIIHGHLREGRLTKDPLREKQWAGAKIVHQIVTEYARDALEHGTFNWDTTLSRIVSVALQSTLSSRTGDLTLSLHYKDVEYLRYEHIQIKVVQFNGRETLEAMVNLKYEKGLKQDGSRNSKVVLRLLEEPQHNMVCVIKLLLILALRTEALAPATYDQILASARARADKSIKWAKPLRPVIAAYSGNGLYLLPDKPASSQQLTLNLQTMADTAGLQQVLVSHDLRRGAAFDHAYISSGTVATASIDTAQAHIRHSEISKSKSITASYVGHERAAPMQARLAPSEVEDNFAVTFASQPYKRQRATKEETDEWMREHGVYSEVYQDRQRAGRQMQKERRQAWVDSTNTVGPLRQQTPSEFNAASPSLETGHTAQQYTSPIDPSLPKQTHQAGRSMKAKSLRKRNFDDHAGDELSVTKSQAHGAESLSQHNRVAVTLTPAQVCSVDGPSQHNQHNPSFIKANDLAAQSLDEGAAIHSASIMSPSSENIGELFTADGLLNTTDHEQLYRQMDINEATQLRTELLLPVGEFVDFFAKINIVSNKSRFDRLKAVNLDGGTKDKPQPMGWPCRNASLGCNHMAANREFLVYHEARCSSDPQYWTSLAARERYVCVEGDCTKSYSTAQALKTHVERDHEGKPSWTPRCCTRKTCDQSIVFQTKVEWHAHRDKEHYGFYAMSCPLPDCTSTEIYTSHPTLVRHLSLKHDLHRAELNAVLPYKEGPKVDPLFAPRKCPLKECGHPTLYYKQASLVAHLNTIHNISRKEATKMLE